jgi:hypothetical protein
MKLFKRKKKRRQDGEEKDAGWQWRREDRVAVNAIRSIGYPSIRQSVIRNP